MILKQNTRAGIKNNKGFSLIEVLIAVSIFSIGILAVASMQLAAINGNKVAGKNTKAVTWSCDRADRILSLPYTHADLDDAPAPDGKTHTPGSEDSDGIDNNENGVIDESGETGQITIFWVVTEGTEPNTKKIDFYVNRMVSGVPRTVMALNFIKAQDI